MERDAERVAEREGRAKQYSSYRVKTNCLMPRTVSRHTLYQLEHY